ncbi:MAG: hypothetical protein DHS20C13_12850 [Thermodesulfobacteriota bacterium]|nr:MAG: hypothetical protein DHS20C13_12850 [Thermodesulfobacteriota bacterium]
MQNKKKANHISTKEKGRILEEIIANLHNQPGIIVERNVFMKSKDGNRKREIDVLLSGGIAGYPIRIAIECKNEKRKIGTGKIDAFIGKLKDINIPVNQGIFVSSSGYTSDAIRRAKEGGLRALNLTGLTKQGLKQTVSDAFQSLIYLLPVVKSISILNTSVPRVENTIDLELFYNEENKVCATVSDLIWQKWLNSDIPSQIGLHVVKFHTPQNWHQKLNGKIENSSTVVVSLDIVGLMLEIAGKAEEYYLLNASDNALEKTHINVTFDSPKSENPLINIHSETELENYLKKHNTVGVVSRMKLPRILNGPVYWPPSENVAKKVIKLMKDYQDGKIPDPRPLKFEDIEGININSAFEPIWNRNLYKGDK